MKVNMYSIYDVSAAYYQPPFVMANHDVAKRTIMMELAKKHDSPMAMYPGDFRLFCLGSFDDNSGSLVSPKNPELVTDLVTLVNGVENDDKK